MSLQRRLLATLGLSLCLLWGATAAWLLGDLHQQLVRTLDQRLAASARMVAALVAQLPADAWERDRGPVLSIPASTGLACQVSSPRGEIVARTHGAPPGVLDAVVPGFGERTVDGERWRTFTYQHERLRITTADRLVERNLLLRGVVLAAVLPFLLALAGGTAALWWGVRTGLRPLERLRRTLAGRHPEALAALETQGLPGELQPLVTTLNHLLGRIGETLAREQRFTSDAAHELRTPLTAIKTHLQVARRADGEVAATALGHAEEAVARLQRTLEQLLTLARLDSGQPWPQGAPALVEDVVRLALADLPARQRLRRSGPAVHAQLAMPRELAATSLRNLLENALRHTPPQAAVMLRLDRDTQGVHFCVLDQGPGVAADRLPYLTQRFWRQGAGAGSGLGLAVVAAIAARFGGRLAFEQRTVGGLEARLTLPERVPAGSPQAPAAAAAPCTACAHRQPAA